MSVSANTSLGEICNTTIQQMEDVTGASFGPMKRTRTGLLDGLLSPVNRANTVRIEYDKGNGHEADVDLHYFRRGTISDATSAFPTDCDFTRSDGYQKDTVSIDLYSGREFFIDESYVKKLCGGGNVNMFNDFIAAELDPMKTDIEDQSITSASGLFGNHISTGNSNTVTHDILDAAANDAIDPGAFTTFASEVIVENQFGSAPIIVAGTSFWRINKTLGMGCCNDDGVEIGQLVNASGYAYFHSHRIDTTLGNNRAIVWDPGAMQLVPKINYRDIAGADSILKSNQALGAYELMDSSARGIMRDPRDGFPFNFKIFYDDCAERFNVLLYFCWTVWGQPTDMFQAGDPLNGTNGILDFTFT